MVKKNIEALGLYVKDFLEPSKDSPDYLNILHVLYFKRREILKENVHDDYLSHKHSKLCEYYSNESWC